MIIPIPQPMRSKTGLEAKGSLLQEAGYGFRYIFSNPSLLGLQMNFIVVNLLAMGTILRTPMILARTGNNEVTLGIVTSITAIGGVVGGLVMSIWGGPKRRIYAVFGGLIVVNLCRAIMGLGHEVFVWSITGFIIMFFVQVTNSSNQAIWQSKTPTDVQGRVFAARRVTGQLSFPLASLIAGPLSDRIFEPAMMAGGNLVPLFGTIIGSGPGAGMSLLILLAALLGIIVPSLSLAIPLFRNVEDIVPDNDIASPPSDVQELPPINPKNPLPRPSTDD